MMWRRWSGIAGSLLVVGCALAEPESRYAEPYPEASSKKGLQVELVQDALELGIDHAALNVNLSALIAPGREAGEDLLNWSEAGEAYQFKREAVSRLDQQIKPLSDAGALVYLILLPYASDNADVNRVLLHPAYDPAAPNRLGAFNTQTEEGRAWLAATAGFLAERWSRPDRQHGRVVGYIVGNEVNSHWFWSNRGRVNFEEFAGDYLCALRLIHDAVRRQSSWARVYVSLDHHWNIRYPAGDEQQAFAGRRLLDELVRRGRASDAGDFDWHVAYHPYPEDLFDPRFWEDTTAWPSSETPRITFKNLDVLTDYLRRPELLFQGVPRRVILSEQGFHAPDRPEGEDIQAAAFCYAYRKVEGNEGIDAFILHRHVDHPQEGGLKLGLRRYIPGASDPRPPKRIYDCFKAADTPEWEDAFRFALPIIGLDNWDTGTNGP